MGKTEAGNSQSTSYSENYSKNSQVSDSLANSLSTSQSNSQSNSVSQSNSQSSQSSLANTQESAVQNRENYLYNVLLPEYQSFYEGLDADSESGKAQLGLTANGINASYDAAQKQTNQSLAQRNLSGTGAGLALTAANNRARSGALANAYANMRANSSQQKGSTLANLQGLAAQTTTAAPTLETSNSTSLSNSTSNSDSYSTSKQQSHSEGSGESGGYSKGQSTNVQYTNAVGGYVI